MGLDTIDQIESEFTKLRGLLSEVATTQKTLDALFIKQKEEAEEAVRKAEQHLAVVIDEQTMMQDILRQESTAVNEVSISSKDEGDAKLRT